jgi:hypothetical protein
MSKYPTDEKQLKKNGKLKKNERQMRKIEKEILKKNKDILKWSIDLKMIDLKENQSFSCMSAYYKFTFNDKITMIWFKEDLNSNSPLDSVNIGNYFDRCRCQIIRVIFDSDIKDTDVSNIMTFTGIDFGNDEPIGEISKKMYSALGLKIIHDDREADIDFFRSIIHDINDICEKRFEHVSNQQLDYPGFDSSCWDIFD